MKYFIAITSLLFATPAFACTATVSIPQASRDFIAANEVAENVMEAFKKAHIIQRRSSKTDNGNGILFCFESTSSDYVDLIHSHLNEVMSFYSGASVNGVDNSTSTKGLTCRSSEVRQAIHSCFDRRPNCPLSQYCSWAYDWYERCSTTRPNRYCF